MKNAASFYNEKTIIQTDILGTRLNKQQKQIREIDIWNRFPSRTNFQQCIRRYFGQREKSHFESDYIHKEKKRFLYNYFHRPYCLSQQNKIFSRIGISV
jgi:hypothetical protein